MGDRHANRKGRIQLTLSPEVWFETLLDSRCASGASNAGDSACFNRASRFTSTDPADRIIAATARVHGHVIITRDRKLLAYSLEGTSA